MLVWADLVANVRETGSFISMVTASSSWTVKSINALFSSEVPVFLTEKKVATGDLSKSMRKRMKYKTKYVGHNPLPPEILTDKYHSVRKI
jgi:hypothetical protein